MACAMKALINRYWGNHRLDADENPEYLLYNNQIIDEIYRLAIINCSLSPQPVLDAAGNPVTRLDGSVEFVDQQCDAEEFLTFLLAECHQATDRILFPD
jgi:hypothetical protein